MGLLWEDIDFDHRTLTARDTKNGLDHMLSMTTYLFELMKQRFDLTGGGTFVFPGNGKSGHVTDIRESLELVESESKVKFTEHDLRRTLCASGRTRGRRFSPHVVF